MDTPAKSPPLPDGMPCPGCGYDVGGQAVRRCPECGLRIDEQVIRIATCRADYRARLRDEFKWFVPLSALVAFWLSMQMGWASGSAMVSLVTGVAAITLIGVSVCFILGASAGMPRHARCEMVGRCRAGATWLMVPMFSAVPLSVAVAMSAWGASLGVLNKSSAEWVAIGAAVLFLATPVLGMLLGVRVYLLRVPDPAGVSWVRGTAVALAGVTLLVLSTLLGGLCLALFADELHHVPR
ncbi:MAG: hypothetical protein K2Q20_05915 [Phycisphaerales bacterium]|nr:hypothetical protein [Phycisphaerales bacterium]